MRQIVKEWCFFGLCILAGILLGQLVPIWLKWPLIICGVLILCGYALFGLMILAFRGEEPEWEKRRREDDAEFERRIEEGKRARREAWRAQGGRFRVAQRKE